MDYEWKEFLASCFGKKVVSVLCGKKDQESFKNSTTPKIPKGITNVDHVPTTMPDNDDRAKLLVMEDNDAVIKMVVKNRAATMRHESRTHRIDLDWFFRTFSS